MKNDVCNILLPIKSILVLLVKKKKKKIDISRGIDV